MATFYELGKDYFERLIVSSVPEKEFGKILSEINKLVYTDSGKLLSNEDKIKIIEVIIKKLESLRKPKQILEHEVLEKAFSNDNYLELINYIKSQI